MPRVDDLIGEINNLHNDIEEYKSKPGVKNPYDVVRNLGKVMKGASVLIPVTWLSKAVDLAGKFLVSYADKNK